MKIGVNPQINMTTKKLRVTDMSGGLYRTQRPYNQPTTFSRGPINRKREQTKAVTQKEIPRQVHTERLKSWHN